MATAVRKTNWFAIWVSVTVVVVIAIIAGLVIWINASATAGNTPGAVGTATPKGSIVNSETGAITFGAGSNTVDTYIDFLCPYCNQFEQSEGPTIKQLIDDGKVTLNVHPVTILDDRSSGTRYSSRAASAMYAVAVADPDNAYAFLEALYAKQPAENTTGLTNNQIVDVAKGAGVNVTADLKDAITSNRYMQFAASHELPSGATGTPTLLVNGSMVGVTMNPQADILARLK
ncbi:MAG: thioredoxin domain-containing protein [Microbacterium sp.]|uniref:DsbA family protein n=1 Tax=Microbacterium sp. TaxID=51671 RepID=UPI001AC228AD|nr:thioredoxin domain-containing protein [Microbacterium sp.]MBN9154999.1 thioredoxin domain-containing protein [Microbacterium sp.]MBN9170451.1 thioredoxin domain-containing protein [Microbacterium sp.]MBN9174262.1 thioredoxin domain-containing protein [Microbacterium sp.]